ncbi:MAG: homoserine dehydrogenase [Crocinitomicaceae bacterium]|nr:homoserine dehydrogenase [Crocinitomicaceae bacterium]
MKNKLTLGLVGFGCVGTGLYEVLNKSSLLDAEIKKIVVKTRGKKRLLPEEVFSYEINDILEDEEINTVVELIDDADAAYKIVVAAFKKGKNVISANKKLIAEHLDELILLSRTNNVSFLYEASVCGSIPVIRNLEEYYNNDTLSKVEGICNGTTNYILTQTNYGKDYETALKESQELGFAESDPTLDVDGFDAKFKLLILIKHAFGITETPENIFNYGIRNIKPEDVKYASEKGYRLKLFSRAERSDNQVFGFVAPHFIAEQHPAYNVNNEFNSVVVEALFSDKQLFVGKGAGSHPTASAVLSDVSALSFDYRYEYKKEEGGKGLSFSPDFEVKVYIGSADISQINQFVFTQVDEVYQSASYNYQTGWINFSQLKGVDFNSKKDLFLALLPEDIRLISSTDNEKVSEYETALF